SSEVNALGAETDAQLLALGANVDDLGEIQTDRSLLALQLVPALRAERFVQGLQLLVAHPQDEYLATVKADADVSRGRHQCACSSAAGSTISVSTPAVARGRMNATREPRIPTRGRSSISARPASLSWLSVASISATW